MTGTELTITRVLAAPRALVWRAWTDEGELHRWLHPLGTTVESIAFDVREGGRYRYTMVAEGTGEQYPTGGVYLEVVPIERLVFTWAGQDDPVEQAPVATVTLVDLGERTEMTFHLRGISPELRDAGVQPGWEQALTHLAVAVEGRA